MHQMRAVTFLRQVTPEREGALLCADMGLGKSSAILHALHLQGLLNEPGVVLGPATAEGTWVDEDSDAQLYYGLQIKPMRGTSVRMDPAELDGAKHVWVNYAILPSWMGLLTTQLRPKWLIFDESHMLCNPGAARTQTAMTLARTNSVQYRFCLTGTPIPNKRIELWSQLAIAQPRQWGGTKHLFGMAYCAGHRESFHDGGHFVFDGESRTLELRARLAGTLIRYLKSQWAESLPEVTRKVVPVDAEEKLNAVGYYDIEREIVRAMRSLGRKGFDEKDVSSIKIRSLTKCISELSKVKADEVVTHVREELRSGRHKHIVVFTYRRETAAKITEALAGEDEDGGFEVYGPVTGMTPRSERKSMAGEFAEAESAVYVATLGAAGVAINNLVQGSLAVFCDLHWSPAVLLQAGDRINREGSPHEKVEMHYFRVASTVDDLFVETLLSKARIIASVTPEDSEGLNLCTGLEPANRGAAETNATAVAAICDMLATLDRWQEELMGEVKK